MTLCRKMKKKIPDLQALNCKIIRVTVNIREAFWYKSSIFTLTACPVS